MPWPTTRDYAEALTDTGLCFADDDLIDGRVDTNADGLPRAQTGNSASVFRVVKDDKAWAVKCFHWHTEEHQKRYDAVQKALAANNASYFIKMKYIKQGIKADGVWYPIVKMEWVDGETLDNYILNNIQFPSRIANVKREFKALEVELARNDFGHLDLQHGNLIVQMDRIRLVDYDCFYVPALSDLDSLELGHHNYQHPKRLKSDNGPYVDNFSAWVIFASLQCISIDSSLWQKLGGGDECLLFRSEDYGNPFASYAFALLESHASVEIRTISRLLRSFCDKPLEEIPAVNETMASPINLKPLPPIKTAPVWIKAGDGERSSAERGTADRGPGEREGADGERPTQSDQRESGGRTTVGMSKGFAYAPFRDYNEAVKTPSESFEDPELANAICFLEDTRVGRNGRIYHFQAEDRDLAVKVFSHHVQERQRHYEAIKQALQGSLRPYVTQAHYLPRGIRIGDDWFPVVKMDWLPGKTLTQMKNTHMNEPTASYLADRFAEMMAAFRAAGVAHGDLDLDNLIVVGNDLKVVDYDAMYVPGLGRGPALESGNPAVQHPGRTLNHFGPYLDCFSSWIVYYLIKYSSVNPSLCDLVDACLADERQTTVVRCAVRGLETERADEVREMGRLLRLLLQHKADTVPFLDTKVGFEQVLKAQTQVAKESTTSASPFIKRKPRS
jgi:tRNA A-37 threonylcarbamoyl transferase component Bud32